MDTINEEDIFLCPESRDRIRHSVYELRLSAMTEIYKSKLAAVDKRARQVLDALPDAIRDCKVSSFK